MACMPQSSVGKKLVMALTGLLLFGFLAAHLTGNLLLLVGPEAFNTYAHKLQTFGPLLKLAEVALAALFMTHIYSGSKVWLANRRARTQGYAVAERLGKGTFSSLTMAVSGTIILLFVLSHVWHVRVLQPGLGEADASGATALYPPVSYHGVPMRDMYTFMAQSFANPSYAIFYLVAMLCLGFHLRHAFQSALRTLGTSQVNYLRLANVASLLLAIMFSVGFAILPVYFLTRARQPQPVSVPALTGVAHLQQHGTPTLLSSSSPSVSGSGSASSPVPSP